jgi:hypothetical protein
MPSLNTESRRSIKRDSMLGTILLILGLISLIACFAVASVSLGLGGLLVLACGAWLLIKTGRILPTAQEGSARASSSSDTPEAPMKASESPAQVGSTINQQLNGLGGWLWVVRINLMLSLVILLGNAADVLSGRYLDITKRGLEYLELRGSYHRGMPEWERLAGIIEYYPTFVIFAVCDLILMAAVIYVYVLFYMKKKQFPRYWVILQVAVFLRVLTGQFSLTVAHQPLNWSACGGAFIALMIWVLYIGTSQRVKATFVQ